MLYFFTPAFFVFSLHLKDILQSNGSHMWLNPGFLAARPLTLDGFLLFWFLNLGVALFLIPLSFLFTNKKQKILFLSLLPLFAIGNIFQLSFRIDHNHTLFNFFFIFMNFYIAFFLSKLWGKGIVKKAICCVLFFFLIVSGVIDLMPIKNDFRYPVVLDGQNTFLQWIKDKTDKNAVFLSRQEILDPITLAGRKNFLGHSYYREVLGYNTKEREELAKTFFEADNQGDFDSMRKEGIGYIVIPKGDSIDFPYNINISFMTKYLSTVYEDDRQTVLKL